MNSVLDVSALLLAIVIAGGITVALMFAHRGENNRRGWITAGVLTAVLVGIGLLDIFRSTPRELHIATPLMGAALPVLGALGMIRGTRRVRAWARWPLVFVTTLILLFGGLLFGATLASRLLPI